jgi:hypothetical protein
MSEALRALADRFAAHVKSRGATGADGVGSVSALAIKAVFPVEAGPMPTGSVGAIGATPKRQMMQAPGPAGPNHFEASGAGTELEQGVKETTFSVASPSGPSGPIAQQDSADVWGLTAAERAAAITRLRREAAPHAGAASRWEQTSHQRPVSWADPADVPYASCFCSCCKGQLWWCETVEPKGWRCSTCHPPDHLLPGQVWEVRT